MPATYTYPGVYVEEIPSGVRTIAGVSTSDTAFIDFFSRGPTDRAVRITSLGDFERIFGGLDRRSEASYAIQQYFLNGGSVAWVIRIVAGNAQTANLHLGSLIVKAASPGIWGNKLEVKVEEVPLVNSNQTPTQFNLLVQEVAEIRGTETVVASETYRNLSMDTNNSRYAVDVIKNESSLVQLQDLGSGVLPNAPDFKRLGANNGDAGTDGTLPGSENWIVSEGASALEGGLDLLDRIAPYIFNILCIPASANLSEESIKSLLPKAIKFCTDKRAFMIVDIPKDKNRDEINAWISDVTINGETNAAIYYPRLEIPDSLNQNRPRNVGVSGTLAGIYARTDAERGVWKAPAGINATLRGATLTEKLTDLENGGLNIFGINVLRNFPIYGNISWGARTLDGADQQASEWKYIPVRRTALYIEESLFQGLKWVVFEPNDEPLWAQIRLNVGAFMNNLFRQGAFQGKSPSEAYLVKCDKETTTQNDINRGIVNIIVGFAPLKPAEFVVLKLQQLAGQVET